MERRAFLAASTAAAVTSADALAGAAARPRSRHRRRGRRSSSCAATACATGPWPRASPPTRRTRSSPRSAAPASRPSAPGTWRWARTARPLHLLLPHPDAASVVTLDARLEADAEYRKAAAPSLALPPVDPPFLSLRLLAARRGRHDARRREAGRAPPRGKDRVFELRTYRSATEAASRRKIEMFEAGGELALFRARRPQHGLLRPRPRGRGPAQPDLHGRVRRRRRAREGLGGVPRAPGVGEDARRSRATPTPSPASTRRCSGRRTTRRSRPGRSAAGTHGYRPSARGS